MQKKVNVGVQAEYHAARTIVMHTPDEEIFYGCLQGTAALFENEPIDRYKAVAEHKNYVQILKGQGIDVKLVTEVLLKGTLGKNGQKKPGKELDDLLKLAEKSLKISYPIELPLDQLNKMKEYKQETLKKQNPKDLVKIILEKPKIYIRECDEGNTPFIAENYQNQPLMNMHFLRDQQITTDKGVVIGKMNSTQRRPETEITTFVFNKLGMKPIYEIQGEGRLEGGDFIPCGNYAFIGQGLRTNSQGIQQLLDNDVFGYKEIAVVKDFYKKQDEMHLDTYFNIAGKNKAVVLKDRLTLDSRKTPMVDVYKKSESGKYIKSEQDIVFKDYLASKGFTTQENSLITLTKDEQLNYGANFLTIDNNKIIAVRGVSNDYVNKMNKAGIKVIEIPFKEFVKTYGAPHCATQVPYRAK